VSGPGTELRGKQRRHLRALGYHLDPTVHLGKNGITPAVVEAVGRGLDAHELIKVRLHETTGQERKAAARDLAEQCRAELVQVLGRMVLLYRRNEDEPGIELPA
jgi:RNA-binding protein